MLQGIVLVLREYFSILTGLGTVNINHSANQDKDLKIK